MITLTPAQRTAVSRMAKALNTERIAVNASPTGTGKTYMALALCAASNVRPTIICPKSVIPSWWAVARAMKVTPHLVTNYEALVAGTRPPAGRWATRGKIWTWDPGRPSLLIFDEAARLRGPTSQTSKLLRAAKKENIPTLLLSATLAEHPGQMRAIGYALGLCAYEYNQWVAWCLANGMRQNPFGALEATPRSAHAMGLIRKGLAPVWISIPATDLPDSTVTTSLVAVTGGKTIDAAYVAGLEDLKKNASTKVVAFLRARQIASEKCLPSMIEMAKDRVLNGYQTVLFAPFIESCKHLSEALKAPWLQSTLTAAERDAVITKFQRDETPILVVSLGVGGEGVNLHGKKPRASIILPDFSASHLIQALGRVRRHGGSYSTQTIIFPDSEVGRNLYTNLSGKLDHLDKLTDNDFIPTI